MKSMKLIAVIARAFIASATPVAFLKATNTKTIANNVHGVPEESLNRMKARWEDYPGETILENFHAD